MKLKIKAGDLDAAGLIQYHLDRARSKDLRGQRVKVFSEDGPITLQGDLVVDPWHAILDFAGAEVRYTGAGRAAVTQLSRKANAFTQLLGGVQNVNLVGTGGTGLLLMGSQEQTRTSASLYGVTVRGFSRGVELGGYSYLTHFYGLIADNNGTGFLWTGGADCGENVTVHGGAISNNDLGLDIQVPGALNLFGVSVDYNGKAVRVTGSGAHVSLIAGHMEMAGKDLLPGQISVNGNSSRFSMVDGEFLLSDRGGPGPYAFPHLVEVLNPNSMVECRGTRLHNHRNATDIWATGPGRVVVDGPTYGQALMPRRGHTSQVQPGATWYAHQEQSPGIMIVTGVPGGRTLATRGSVGKGFVQVLGLAAPVSTMRGRRLSVSARLESNMDATAGVSFYWANGVPGGAPVQTAPASAIVWAGTPTAPAVVAFTSDLRVPPWATHLLTAIDISGGSAGKWLAVDQFEIAPW